MTRALRAAVLLAVAALPAGAYIDTLVCPLDQFNSTFQVIAEGVVEKVDVDKKIAIFRIGRVLKGKTELSRVRLNVGAGQHGHPEVVMPHLVPGAPAVLWYYWGDGPKTAIYVSRFFLEGYRNQDGAAPEPDRVWWHFSSVATLFNRTYNGSVEELRPLLDGILAGKIKAPAPDPKLPPITRESIAALPVWGAPPAGRKLPLCFRSRVRAGAPRPADAAAPAASGVAWKVYEGSWDALPDLSKASPSKQGVAAEIGLALRPREAGYALRFSGWIDVPRDGVYAFTLASNDGARLSLGGAELIDNDHLHGVVESGGEAALKAGKHAFVLDYFQHSGFQVLELDWEGPGIPRGPVPPSAFFRAERP